MYQKIILIGRVGKDPEVKHLENGVVASFSLACSESYTNKAGEKVENTEWFRLSIWGKLAEIAEKYVHKGDLLYVEGQQKTRSYEKDGENKKFTEIRVDLFKMLGGKKAESSESDYSHDDNSMPDDDSDLPF